MSDPTVAHARYFTEAERVAVLEVLQKLALQLNGTPQDGDTVVIDEGPPRYADPSTPDQGWISTTVLVLRVSYARFLEIQAAPPGLVVQTFHLPDTTVLLAYHRNPDAHTPPAWEGNAP